MTFNIKKYITEANDELNESPAFNGADFVDAMWKYVKGKNLNGWKVEFEMSGAWAWTHPNHKKVWVFATPFWEGSKGIEVGVADDAGGYKNFRIPFQAGQSGDTSSPDQLKKASQRYLQLMKMWLSKHRNNLNKWNKEGVHLLRPRGMEDNPFQ